MKKLYLLLFFIASISISYSQCNYTLTLTDDNSNGWYDRWGNMNGYIIVDTGGTDIYYWTLSSGASSTHIITVNTGSVLTLTYDSQCGTNSRCYESQNHWDLTDCNGNSVWSGTGGSDATTTITVDCSSCTPLVSTDGDCGVAPTVCSDEDVTSNSTGLGNHNDLNLTNHDCLLGNEHYSSWIFFHAQTAGLLEFTIHPNNEDGGTNDDYDFAVWSSSTCPPTSTPIRCSWAVAGDQSSYSGCSSRDIGYDTGMGTANMLDAADDSEGMCGDGWVNGVNANAGDEFTLLVDNYSSTSNSFTLSWSLTGGATLDCDPLPVNYIPLTYDCFTQKLEWQTLSEINNDYFIIETGNSFDIDGNLIISNTYVVNGNGTTNYISKYSYYLDLNNLYIRLSQVDYNGTTKELEIRYFNCSNPKAEEIKLYPNPAEINSIVYIEGQYNNIEVYDLVGKKINTKISNNQIIGLSKGVYFVRFDNNNPIRLIIQ